MVSPNKPVTQSTSEFLTNVIRLQKVHSPTSMRFIKLGTPIASYGEFFLVPNPSCDTRHTPHTQQQQPHIISQGRSKRQAPASWIIHFCFIRCNPGTRRRELHTKWSSAVPIHTLCTRSTDDSKSRVKKARRTR